MTFEAVHSQRGNATLYAIAVLALVSFAVAAQLDRLARRSELTQMSRRELATQRARMNAIGLFNDLVRQKHVDYRCKDGARQAFVSAKAPVDVQHRLQRVFDARKQAITYSFCDPTHLSSQDLAALFRPGGAEPTACKRITADVAITELPCKPQQQFAVVAGDDSRAVAARFALKPNKPGCPFTCHLGTEGNDAKWKRARIPPE